MIILYLDAKQIFQMLALHLEDIQQSEQHLLLMQILGKVMKVLFIFLHVILWY